MSNNNSNEKGILQDIIDEQRKLDRAVMKDRDLFNSQNQVDLTINFDENRRQALLMSYVHLRTAVKMIRMVGAKWWKNQKQMTEGDLDVFLSDVKNGRFFDTHTDIDNISMKIIAIIQELIELEDAINEGKGFRDVQEEYIDIIHFVVSLGLDLGLSSENTIKDIYSAKNAVNHQRVQSNY